MAGPSNTLRIRGLSLLALLLLVAIFWIGITLVLTNPGMLLIYAVCGAVLLIGSWLVLTRSSKQRALGVGLTVVAIASLVGVTWVFLGQQENRWRLLALIVVGVAYGALAGALARLYWAGRRAGSTAGQSDYHRPVLIINPKSGGGRATKAHIADKARERGIAVTVMAPGQDMVALARAAAEQGADVIGVSGGDGGLGAVAGVAMEHGLPLVVLPGGTRCHFARDIGLDPERIADALNGFEGIERTVDVGLVNGRVFLNNVSFGLYADITNRPEYRDHKAAVTRTVLRELAASEKPYYPLQFRDNEGQRHTHAAQILVGVNRYETLKLGELGERKQLDGGILQVIMIPALDDQTAARLARLALPLGKPGQATGGLTEWMERKFTVTAPGGFVMAGIDGESVKLESPVRVHIVPKALRLLVPAAGPRSRPMKPVSRGAARALWSLVSGRQS